MRKYFPQGVLWCKKPEREHGARQPLPLTAAVFLPARLCRAIAQSAMQKTAGAPSEAVPLSSRRRTGGEWLEPATLPYPQQAMPSNRAKRDAKNSRSAERGCSSVLTPLNRRRTVGASNPALPPAGYVPHLYTYPTKFMHNLCHIVM